jgi:Amino acid permease
MVLLVRVHILSDDDSINYKRCVMIPPLEASAMQGLMQYWIPDSTVPGGVWIAIFIVIPTAFNFFNVRRYGEIEFWLTTIKVITLIGLILLGIILPMDASPVRPLLGEINYQPAPCGPNSTNCVSQPGFNCIPHYFSLFWRLQSLPSRPCVLGRVHVQLGIHIGPVDCIDCFRPPRTLLVCFHSAQNEYLGMDDSEFIGH